MLSIANRLIEFWPGGITTKTLGQDGQISSLVEETTNQVVCISRRPRGQSRVRVFERGKRQPVVNKIVPATFSTRK
jgi:hypothetical protein